MAELMLVNPRKRRTKRRRSVARKSPVRRRRSTSMRVAPKRRYRRNPIGGNKIMDQVSNAAVGAAGALAVDVAMTKLPIPDNLVATPIMRSATQGAVSLALGMLVKNFGKKAKLGRQLAEGGLTVALHGVGKGMIGPAVGLSGYDDSLLGYDDSLLGFQTIDNSMGWYGAAPVSNRPPSMEAYDLFEEDEF